MSFFPTRSGIEADDPHRRGCGCRACTRDLVAALPPAERSAIAAALGSRSARPRRFVNGPATADQLIDGRLLADKVARRLGRPAETVDDLTADEKAQWDALPPAACEAMFAVTVGAARRGADLERRARNIGTRPRPERAVRARR